MEYFLYFSITLTNINLKYKSRYLCYQKQIYLRKCIVITFQIHKLIINILNRKLKQMSGEQQFQLLISNQDYLNLQSKCNTLQALCQKQTKQNKDQSLKIFDLKEENQALLARNVHNDQKIRDLQNNDKSKANEIVTLLSLNEQITNQMRKKQYQILTIKKQISEISKTKEKQILTLQSQTSKLSKKMEEKQKQLASIKQLLNKQKKEKQDIAKLVQRLKEENEKTKESYERLNLKNHQQVLLIEKKVSDIQKVNTQKIVQLGSIMQQKDRLIMKVSELKKQNEKMKNQNQLITKSSIWFQEQLVSTKKQIEKHQRLIQENKLSNEQKLQNSQKYNNILRKQIQQLRSQFQSEYKAKIQKQNNEKQLRAKILSLQDQLAKQKKNSEAIEKQYEEIISSLQNQKKLLQKSLQNSQKPKTTSRINDKSQKDQLQQIKARLQQYFTNLAVNLYEVGNLDQQDIKGILVQQEQIVKSYVTDITAPFFIKRKERGPPQFHKF